MLRLPSLPFIVFTSGVQQELSWNPCSTAPVLLPGTPSSLAVMHLVARSLGPPKAQPCTFSVTNTQSSCLDGLPGLSSRFISPCFLSMVSLSCSAHLSRALLRSPEAGSGCVCWGRCFLGLSGKTLWAPAPQGAVGRDARNPPPGFCHLLHILRFFCIFVSFFIFGCVGSSLLRAVFL